MAYPVVETERLTLRAFDEEDIEPLYAIMSDPVAMQYTYVAPSKEHCIQRLHTYAALQDTLGYAPWSVVLRSEERVIGWGGLNIDPFDPGWGVEVAYCLHPAYWGKGYATEVVRAAIDVGFGTFQVPTLVAFTHVENSGSARVLEKCGFRLLGYEARLDRNHYQLQASSPSGFPSSTPCRTSP